jgi:NADH-quinone oxidoreductase subunit E
MSALSPHLLDEIKQLPARYPQPRSAVMPALDLAQEEIGHLTPEAMSEVAAALELDPGYVEGVATFYTLFHLSPVGKHHFYLCTNLSCALRGAGEIVDHVKKSIGVHSPDEVSADGLFSYEEVECLGACEFAPMMRFDHRYHYDLTPEKIDAVIAEKKGLVPARGEVAAKPAEGKGLLPTRGEVAPQAPEGRAKKPRAPRKKKAADA